VLPFFFLLAVPSPPVLAPVVHPPNLLAIIALRASSNALASIIARLQAEAESGRQKKVDGPFLADILDGSSQLNVLNSNKWDTNVEIINFKFSIFSLI
jgi:hypothetical protein